MPRIHDIALRYGGVCAHAYIVYDHQLNIHVGSNELIFCDARAKCVSGRVIVLAPMRVHIRHQHSYNARVYPRECTKGPTPSFKCYVRHTLRTKDGSLPFPPIPSFDASFMMHEYSFGLVGRVHETGIENCYLFFAKVDIDNSPSIKNKWIILVRELKEFSLEFFHFLRRFFPTRLEYSFGRWTWVQLSRVVLESH